MKKILFVLCVFIALITSANAIEMYKCIDSNGYPIVTSHPQDGMQNCVLMESDRESSTEEKATETKEGTVKKDNAIVKTEDTPEARQKRINDCISCCNDKQSVCYNYTADDRLCGAESQNCSSTCNSEGASSSSSGSECWSQSDK